MRVAVLVKHKGERRWNAPDVGRWLWPETMLQTILSEDPDLIPFDDERRPVVVVDEFAVSFGFVDLVGVGSTGSITIGECKKQDNAEIKRTVVGQLFAYAAAIWGMSYEEFDDLWQAKKRPGMTHDAAWEKRKRPPLTDAVKIAAEERGLPFDAETFRATVTENLRTCRFTLLLAVDEITPELQRTVEYLGGHMSAGVDVIALELGYVTHGDVEVLVPNTYGLEVAEQKDTTRHDRVAADEPAFMAAIRSSTGDWAEPMARALLAWAKEAKLDIWYGEGTKVGNINIGIPDGSGTRRTLVSCWTSGIVEIEFKQWSYLRPFDSPDERVEVLHRVAAVEGQSRPDKQADSWSQLKMGSLEKSDGLPRLTAILGEVVSRIRETQSQDEGRRDA